MKKSIIVSMLMFLLAMVIGPLALAYNQNSLSGRVLLQTEKNGELWYLDPVKQERFMVKNSYDMLRLMRFYGLGIRNTDLIKIAAFGETKPTNANMNLAKKLSGRILINVENNGEAWYVNPTNYMRYYLGTPQKAYELFKKIAIKATDKDINLSKESKSIVSIAAENGNFKTLVAAVQAAGLAETLDKQGPFTVFAPTDKAFAKLPAGTVDALLKDIPKLKSILLYHVIGSKVTANQVVKLTEAKTLNGQSLMIKVEGGKVMVDNATVTATDIMANNGVIHVIDSVLLPK